jgi:hypothetical protein
MVGRPLSLAKRPSGKKTEGILDQCHPVKLHTHGTTSAVSLRQSPLCQIGCVVNLVARADVAGMIAVQTAGVLQQRSLP